MLAKIMFCGAGVERVAGKIAFTLKQLKHFLWHGKSLIARLVANGAITLRNNQVFWRMNFELNGATVTTSLVCYHFVTHLYVFELS